MGNYLITGGSGFVGSHFVGRLIEAGHRVHVIDVRSEDPHTKTHPKAIYHNADITDTAVIDLIDEIQPDYVYHLATAFSSPTNNHDVKDIVEVNVLGTINVLEGAVKANVKRFVFTSTGAVYGQPAYIGMDENHPLCPVTPYGMTKRSAEEFVQLYNRLYDLPYTILRLATVYGMRQLTFSDGDLIADLIQKYMHHSPVTLKGDGQYSRDFIYIEDVLDVLEICISRGSNAVFNIGSGHGTLLNELINLLNATFEMHVEPNFVPNDHTQVKDSYFDISHALAQLDWSPRFDLADGILETVHYYRRTLRM